MKRSPLFIICAFMAVLLTTSCSKPPKNELETAKMALEVIQQIEGKNFIIAEIKAQQDSLASVNALIELENQKFALTRDYKVAIEKLNAIAASTEALKATAETRQAEDMKIQAEQREKEAAQKAEEEKQAAAEAEELAAQNAKTARAAQKAAQAKATKPESSAVTYDTRATYSTKGKSQKELFDKFFSLDDGDTVDLSLKTKLMSLIFQMDSSTQYAKYMPGYAGMLQQKNNDNTLYHIEWMIKKYPDFAEIYCLYGQALYYAKKDGAIDQIQKCIEKNPKLMQPYYILASMYEQMKNYKIALVYYDKLEKINNKHKSLYYNRGWVKSELKDMAGSIADYTKCIEMQPRHERAIFNRGKIYLATNEYAKAVADFDTFVKLMPTYGPAYYNLAVAKYYLDRKEEACKDAQKGQAIGDKSCIDYLQKYCK